MAQLASELTARQEIAARCLAALMSDSRTADEMHRSAKRLNNGSDMIEIMVAVSLDAADRLLAASPP